MINGSYNKLGYYDTQSDNLTWMDMEKWAGHKVRNHKTSLTLVLCAVLARARHQLKNRRKKTEFALIKEKLN